MFKIILYYICQIFDFFFCRQVLIFEVIKLIFYDEFIIEVIGEFDFFVRYVVKWVIIGDYWRLLYRYIYRYIYDDLILFFGCF